MKIGQKFRSATPYTSKVNPNWFEYRGIFRKPLKGEYYVSGAIPEVYQALADLSTGFHIVVPVPDPPKQIEHDGFTYYLGR